MPAPKERFNLSVTTTSGDIHAQLDIPAGFIPITEIVPVVRSLGEQAQAQEVANTLRTGKTISCQKGCSACCRRIMVPVSPPEAFALAEMLQTLPRDHRERIETRLSQTREQLSQAGLLPVLQQLAESPIQQSDADVDPINRAYYALRLPCIFLENDACSIYEHRPAACREYLVDTPAEWCQDTEKNHVQELPIPIRGGTVLSILWAELTGGPLRLMPIPVAFEWAEKHRNLRQKTWKGIDLLNSALDGLGKFLQQSFASFQPKHPNPDHGASMTETHPASSEQPTERHS